MPATTHYNLDKLVAGAVDWLALFNSNVDKNEAGRTIKKIAGETIVVRDPFYISSSDGKAYKAANTNVCHGIWQSTSTTTDTEGFGQVEGIMTYGSWTWTRGNWIYVSASKTLTQTPPSANIQPIAFAISTTEIYIVGTALRMRDDGSYVLACAGTNQSIILTPSGTGGLVVTGKLDIDGDGKQIITAILNDATGDEAGIKINYTTNKATSGNDTGLEVNQTDTASPGTSKLLDLKVGGSSKIGVSNTGIIEHSPSDFAGTPVAPTAAVKAFLYNKTVADDSYITLPSVTNSAYGICIVGDNEERTQFWLNSTGTVTLLNSSAKVVANTNTDTKVCIGTAAPQEPLQIKNRLGSAKTINVMLWYN